MNENKNIATEFLKMVMAGNIDEAYSKYVDMQGKHHNTFTLTGFAALEEGMKSAGKQFPEMKSVIHHTIAEGELVAIHSHITLEQGKSEMTAVHIFRFENNKIVEMWDIAQSIIGSVNTDGAF